MKSNGLLCLLLLIHDGQLQAAGCLINKLLKWYFSKYYQVRTRPVFPRKVTFKLSFFASSYIDCFFRAGRYRLQYKRSHEKGSGMVC